MENIISDSILEKIQKLLRLSASDNENERALALEKAHKLAAEHNVNLALVQVFEGRKSEVPITKREGIALGNRKSICQRFVSWIIQDYFNVKVIYSGSRHFGLKMALIGTEENIKIAEYVQGYLNQEFMRLWHKHREETGCTLQERNSYLDGLHSGLSARLRAERAAVETEVLATQPEEIKNQFGLVRVADADRLQAKVEEFYPKLRKAAPSRAGGHYSSNAIVAGMAAGRQISLRRGIEGGSNSRLTA